MADGKWIPGLTPDLPAIDAARRVLAARLDVVTHYLPLAAKRPAETVEYVHQLRVATRRSMSALRIFEAFVPRKHFKRTKNELRAIRQAAGVARDWDVFQDSLAKWSTSRPVEETPALDFLRGLAFVERASVQQGLLDAVAVGFDARPLIAAIGVPDSFEGPGRLGNLAASMIDEMLSRLDSHVNAGVTDLEHLHFIRIEGKRLRYAMEVFANCFAPPFREKLYPAIEKLQEILGDGNDSHVAVQRLTALRHQVQAFRPGDWPRLRPGFEALICHHERQLPLAQSRFVDWLDSWRTLRALVSS